MVPAAVTVSSPLSASYSFFLALPHTPKRVTFTYLYLNQLWLSLKYPAKDYPEPGYHAMRTWILLAMPHVVCLTIFIPALAVSQRSLCKPFWELNHVCVRSTGLLNPLQILDDQPTTISVYGLVRHCTSPRKLTPFIAPY